MSLSNFLNASVCSLKKKEVEFLNKKLGNKIASLTLFYRGSRDGWMYEDFHNNCDNSGPTISLF